MKQTNCEERQSGRAFFKLAHFAAVVIIALTGFTFSSCGGDDDEPAKNASLIGTWVYEELNQDDDVMENVKMTLKFDANNTGSIVEEWLYETRASSHETYSMKFSWSTTSDSNGNDILRISYVSGDKNTELFPGGVNTVLWTRQYVLTGKILNIYGGDGVWVFNRK